ncbi:MAG: rhodanese-like domain-containing protein, partial [Terriglobales bacterium]
SVLALPDGPCYRCWYPEPPPPGLVPSCAEGGVLGVLPGLMGLIQATEAIKLITGIGEPLKNRVLLFDALRMKFRELKLRKNPDCAVCGNQPTIRKLIDYQEFCGIPAASATPAAETSGILEVTPAEFARERANGSAPLLLDVREPHEFDIARIPGSVLIPLGELPGRLGELDPAADIVVHCKAGGRSMKAARLLQSEGFAHVRNLKGGILAWSDQVDSSVPKY